MDFTALRTQVIELLQREQRLSYRALKRQFTLDDEDLEALIVSQNSCTLPCVGIS